MTHVWILLYFAESYGSARWNFWIESVWVWKEIDWTVIWGTCSRYSIAWEISGSFGVIGIELGTERWSEAINWEVDKFEHCVSIWTVKYKVVFDSVILWTWFVFVCLIWVTRSPRVHVFYLSVQVQDLQNSCINNL